MLLGDINRNRAKMRRGLAFRYLRISQDGGEKKGPIYGPFDGTEVLFARSGRRRLTKSRDKGVGDKLFVNANGQRSVLNRGC
ncbi:hypothetical protein R50072_05110 [Simiduia litorea]